jgi:hypothetical protein
MLLHPNPNAKGSYEVSVTLVRSLSFIFKNLQERSVQLWSSDRSRHARDWVANRLKQADSRIRAVRLAHPRAFWAVVIATVPVAVIVVMFALIWEGYGANREAITPIATIIVATVLASAALKQAATASRRHYAQTEADQQRRIVESFTKTVEQLGSDHPPPQRSRPGHHASHPRWAPASRPI